MARLSKVSLSHINIPGNHCFAFINNAARDSWFDGRTKQDYDNMSYLREDDIQIPVKMDAVRQYNFGYYFNETGDRIYFRITNMLYINENNTLLQIEKDVLLTYLPTSNMQPSFIERSNEIPSSIFDSDVPEIQYNGGFTYTLLDTFGSSSNFDFFVQQAGSSDPDIQASYWTKVVAKNFNDDETEVIFPSRFMFMDDPADFSTVAGIYAQAGTGDRLLSAGFLPSDDYVQTLDNTGEPTDLGSVLESVRNTKTVSVSTSINNRIAKDNVTIVIAEIDNFANQIEIPISELSGGSIGLVSVSDPITQQRHYAVLSGADGDNELKYRIVINVGGSLPSMNLPAYMAMRNIETDLGAQQTNNAIGGASSITSGGAQGGVVGSVGGPVGAIGGAAAGAASAGVTTATNAIQNEVSAAAALEKAKRLAPTVSGTLAGFGIFANRSLGVNIFIKEPSGSGLSQLQDYYRFFGYNKSRIITPTVTSGTKFYQGNVNGNFPGASATDTAIIRSLFNTGVWIWTNEAAEFDY